MHPDHHRLLRKLLPDVRLRSSLLAFFVSDPCRVSCKTSILAWILPWHLLQKLPLRAPHLFERFLYFTPSFSSFLVPEDFLLSSCSARLFSHHFLLPSKRFHLSSCIPGCYQTPHQPLQTFASPSRREKIHRVSTLFPPFFFFSFSLYLVPSFVNVYILVRFLAPLFFLVPFLVCFPTFALPPLLPVCRFFLPSSLPQPSNL